MPHLAVQARLELAACYLAPADPAAALTLLREIEQILLRRADLGEELFLSPNTVKSQAVSIYRKLGVSNRSQASRNPAS